MTKEQYIENFKRMAYLKAKLNETDYITNKLTEAIAVAMVQGDNTRLVDVYNEYKELIAQRQAWRDEINRLEQQLKIREVGV